MRKRLLTLLTLVLGVCSGVWAQTTIGLTQANDGISVEKSGTTYKGTLAAPTYTGATNLTVAESLGSLCKSGQSERNTTGSDGSYWATKCFRKEKDNNTGDKKWMANEWVGYTISVASGYKVSLSNIQATLWDA
ncbi:MAG: hypothetical protein J5965_15925, partial [Aeriscardovia sp.]|nr:hypothetical protein [Aeriscardovia sp.]